MLTCTIGARYHQAMQRGQEHRALDGEFEATSGKQALHDGATSALLPQPFKQQRRADATTYDVRRTATLDQGEDHRALRQPGRGARQPIEIARGFDVFFTAEIANDALLGLA